MKIKNILANTVLPIMLISAIGTAISEAKQTNTPAKNNDTFTLKPARVSNGSVVGTAWSLPKQGEGGYNSTMQLAPASTMKVLTAAAALTVLGGNYRFETIIKANEIAYKNAPQTGVLNSDLVIQFSGDPTLTSSRLKNLLKEALNKKNIKQINGDVILDTSLFVGYDRGLGWTWDDLPLCFSAPAGAIVIDHNCIYTSVILNKGAKQFVMNSASRYAPIKIAMNTPLLPKDQYRADHCDLRVEPSIENVYNISGCFSNTINLSKNYKLDFKFAVQNPDRWGLDIVKIMLDDLGVKVKGKIIVSRLTIPHVISVATSQSAPLDKLLDHTLKRSDNLYAEEIARAAARSYYHYPVSIKQAAIGVQAILKRHGGVDFKGTSIYDGSGLSSYNIISPQVVLQVLKYVKANDNKLHMINLLPQSAVSGTLRFRRSVVNYPLKTNVIAKTGTIRNVRNLAGFVKSINGNLVPFVIYTTGFSPDKSEVKYMSVNKTMWPNFEYEKRVLQYLYEEQVPIIQ